MSTFVLVIDQGTTGTQASLFRAQDMDMLANCKIEFPQHFPHSGWVEHDLCEIESSVQEAVRVARQRLEEKLQGESYEIVAVGITNQRETCAAFHKKTGVPAARAIVWQDRRTAAACEVLRVKHREGIHKKTGLVCDPYFSGSKMQWLLQHNPTVKDWAAKGDLALSTIDAWLVHRLTAGESFVTDHTNASRTMLYSLETGGWDGELLALFGVPPAALPLVQPSSALFGKTKGFPGIPDGVPILGVLGDQQAALFGQRCLRPGEAKITYGTGAFLLLNTGTEAIHSPDGLLTTVAYSHGTQRTFALEGAAFIAGAAIQFLRDGLGFFENSAACEALALSEPADPQLLFVPALAGLAAPHWNPNARGVLWGLSRGSSRAQITRAVLESIAFQNGTLLELMQKSARLPLTRVGVDGGASKNDFLMQFQSDVLQVELRRPQNPETTSLGAALAALTTLGRVPSFGSYFRSFMPNSCSTDIKTQQNRWKEAVEGVNSFYK